MLSDGAPFHSPCQLGRMSLPALCRKVTWNISYGPKSKLSSSLLNLISLARLQDLHPISHVAGASRSPGFLVVRCACRFQPQSIAVRLCRDRGEELDGRPGNHLLTAQAAHKIADGDAGGHRYYFELSCFPPHQI